MRCKSILFVVPLLVACSGTDATTGSTKGSATKNEQNDTDPGDDQGGTDTPPPGTHSPAPPPPPPPAGDVDAGHDSGTPAASGKDLGETCAADKDCKSNVCFQGGNGSYCSLKCTTANAATVCVPPAFNGQCNKQGFCRKP